jgi:metalloendopeptidase OMA1, mitochondrial
MQRRHIAIAPVLIALAVMLFKYFTAEKFVNPETGRVSHVSMSPGQEASLGLQSYQEVLSTEHVITEGPDVDMVKRVVKRLVAATGETGQSYEWQVSVVQSDTVNAFCLPGGKIVVYTGILPVAKTEAGLATVLGHEMAHATSRHGAQRLYESDMFQTLLSGAQASISMSDMDPNKRMAVMAALGAGGKYGVMLPFGRKHESEADAIGLMYMARAGYDPNEAITFWQRMVEMAGAGQPPQFASDHPSHETRIAQLRELLPKAMEEYQRSAAAKNQ